MTTRYFGQRIKRNEDFRMLTGQALHVDDINLPDMSGREVTTMLRSDVRFRTTPIVALTAMSMSAAARRAAAPRSRLAAARREATQ